MRLLITALLASALSATVHAAEAGKPPAATKDGDTAAVKAAIEAYVATFEKKDATAMGALLVRDPDVVNFGTDTAETWIGYDAVMASVVQQFKAVERQKAMLRDLRVKMLAGGKVAVATYLLDWEGKSMGEPFAIKGLRATTVLEKRSGRWLMVSSHNSIPVSGQAVKY